MNCFSKKKAAFIHKFANVTAKPMHKLMDFAILFFTDKIWQDTLPETNIVPENGWFEYYFPIGEAYFQGLC